MPRTKRDQKARETILDYSPYPIARDDMLVFLKGAKKFFQAKSCFEEVDVGVLKRVLKVSELERGKGKLRKYSAFIEYLNLCYCALLIYNVLPKSFFVNPLQVLEKGYNIKCCNYLKENYNIMETDEQWTNELKSKLNNNILTFDKKVDVKEIDKVMMGKIRVRILNGTYFIEKFEEESEEQEEKKEEVNKEERPKEEKMEEERSEESSEEPSEEEKEEKVEVKQELVEKIVEKAIKKTRGEEETEAVIEIA